MKSLRLAKRIAAQRLCSRREAERIISAGHVKVNGEKVKTTNGFALIKPTDKVEVLGHGVLPKLIIPKHHDEKEGSQVELVSCMSERTKLFLCNKLKGELVSYTDDLARPTVFQRLEMMGLPKNLISVGRLDYHTDGLLLFTNNGYFSRQLELPANAFLRKYRAIVWTYNGEIDQKRLRWIQNSHGLTVNNVPMQAIKANVVAHTRQNQSIIEVEVHEGKYREVRRLLELAGMKVSKLTRMKYGPFTLENLAKGSVLEVNIPSELKRYLQPPTASIERPAHSETHSENNHVV